MFWSWIVAKVKLFRIFEQIREDVKILAFELKHPEISWNIQNGIFQGYLVVNYNFILILKDEGYKSK